jgi:hypothetical protein
MSKTDDIVNAFRARQKQQEVEEDMKKEKEKPAVENPPPSADLAIAADFEEDFFVYGSDKTKRQKNMLSLVMLDNRVLHLPYNQIMFVDVQHTRLLSIYTHFGIISIEGKKLDLIAQRIKHGSLSYINEGGKKKPPVTPDGVAVYSIFVEIVGRKEAD